MCVLRRRTADSFSPVTITPDETAVDNPGENKVNADRDTAGKVPEIPVPSVEVPPAAR